MNYLVKQVLRDHFPTMTADQLDRMQYDNSGCYHDGFGDETVWMSPKLIYRLLRDLSDEYEEELQSAARRNVVASILPEPKERYGMRRLSSNETEMNEIDHDLERFHTLRRRYDPFWKLSDDSREYLRYFSIYRELTYLKNDLGLWGQDLDIPVYNPKTYTLEYV